MHLRNTNINGFWRAVVVLHGDKLVSKPKITFKKLVMQSHEFHNDAISEAEYYERQGQMLYERP